MKNMKTKMTANPKNMNNLKQYFEYEKNNLDVSEGDFLRILNSVDTRKVNYGSFVKENRTKSEYFGWAFGFAGLSLAAFMFFIAPKTDTATVATITKADVQSLREKNRQAVQLIDSISSFDNINNQ